MHTGSGQNGCEARGSRSVGLPSKCEARTLRVLLADLFHQGVLPHAAHRVLGVDEESGAATSVLLRADAAFGSPCQSKGNACLR